MLALLVATAFVAPQVWAAPADVVNISAPKIGAEPPQSQDIADGDVSVATSTGALQYGYPFALPPGKMQPSLSLSYSSQAPIYGGIAAGWTLSGLPDVRQDGSRGMKDRTRGEINNQREYEHYVSNLAGGRPLIEVQEPMGAGADKAFRAQNDSSYARYERMDDGQFFTWRVLTTDGTTHFFGEQARITGWVPWYASREPR